MENVYFHNPRGMRISAAYHVPEKKTDKIIIMDHGFLCSKDWPKLFTDAADAFVKAGFAVLRFDHCGCGESESTSISMAKQQGDLRIAQQFAEERGYDTIGLLGWSLGGYYALKGARKMVKTMVLWAPVTHPKIPDTILGKRVIEDLEVSGEAEVVFNGRAHRVEREFVEERKKIDPSALKPTVPVLIVHGDADTDVPLIDSENVMNQFPEGSELTVIEGGNHEFSAEGETVIKNSVAWFQKHLGA